MYAQNVGCLSRKPGLYFGAAIDGTAETNVVVSERPGAETWCDR